MIDQETASEEKNLLIHLTEDNIDSLRREVGEVRDALRAKFPDKTFPRILPHLNPDCIVPKMSLFEQVLAPDPAQNLYGSFGWTVRADRLPYCVLLAKFIGIQMDVETPFIEELLMWVHQIMNHDEDVPCRNSQWRHDYFQKRRNLLTENFKKILHREIMDLIMVTQHFKDGTLIEEAGFFSYCAALWQRKMLEDAWAYDREYQHTCTWYVHPQKRERGAS